MALQVLLGLIINAISQAPYVHWNKQNWCYCQSKDFSGASDNEDTERHQYSNF